MFIFQASRDSVLHQIAKGKIQTSKNSHEGFSLIIDGRSLAYALEDDIKYQFLDLAFGCETVICCRSTPKQKALVSYLYTKH